MNYFLKDIFPDNEFMNYKYKKYDFNSYSYFENYLTKITGWPLSSNY